jgi:surface antigen
MIQVNVRQRLHELIMLMVSVLVAGLAVFLSPQSAMAGTDDYPSPWRAPAVADTVADTWAFLNRECTSFVAWRLHSRNGFELYNDYDHNGSLDFRGADNWASAAQSFGFSVNSTPAVGTVAWFSSGHVAWVEAVNGSNVTIEEYNYNAGQGPYNYWERTIAASSVSGFIHFAPALAYSIVSQDYYTDSTKTVSTNTTVYPGGHTWLVLRVRNTGTSTWYKEGSNPVHLGTWSAQDRISRFVDSTWMGGDRPAKLDETSVAPNDIGTFEFQITVPNGDNGTWDEHFNLVMENQGWFPDSGMYFELIVRPLAYTVVSQEYYSDSTKTLSTNTTVYPNGRPWLVLKAKNTGSNTWYKTGSNPVRLATSSPNDRTSRFADGSWHSGTRPAVMDEASVAPGQVGTFEFQLTVPSDAGTWNEHFNLVMENQGWLTPSNDWYFQVIVQNNGARSYSYVSQIYYTDSTKTTSTNTTVYPGTHPWLVLKVRNTGTSTWSKGGGTPTRLATSSPNDRASHFQDGTWPTTTRPAVLTESSVLPGQVGTFEFQISVPSGPGTWNEHVNLVTEYQGWFSEIGVYFQLIVP